MERIHSDPEGDERAVSPEELRQRIRREAAAYQFDALIEGVSSARPPVAPPKPRVPRFAWAGAAALALCVGVYAARPRSGPVSAPPVNAAPLANAPANVPASAASARVRLPAALPGSAPAAAQAPVFILSDFENGRGAWEPDPRLPGSAGARVARVRDRAQQGNYWLKMDGVALDSGSAPEAAFRVRPDKSDLSRNGTTVTAGLFLPRDAPEGLQAGLAIVDQYGRTRRQEGRTRLLPGLWTTVNWDAGRRMENVAQLEVVIYAGDKKYDGCVGLDNVLLHEEAAAPAMSDLTVTMTPEGFVRVGSKDGYLAQFGMVVCGPGWQTAAQRARRVRAEADGILMQGTLPAPGAEGGSMPFQARVCAVDERTLEIQVEATPARPILVRALALEALLPRALYGNANLDFAAVRDAPSGSALPLTAEADAAQIAGDYPGGFVLKADAPAVFRAAEDTVSTTFTYAADKPLQSVNLAGDFNQWNTKATPMTAGADGRTWSVSAPVSPGERQYKFVLNGGEWITDPKAAKNVPDKDGNINSVRLVLRDLGRADEAAFHLWATLAGRADSAPITLEAGQTLRRTFRITFNQPFTNALGRARR